MTNLELIEHIGILVLDNPPQNFLEDPEFISKEKLMEFISKNAIKGLIIKGVGRHFSAGANLEALKDQVIDQSIEEKLNKGKELLSAINNLEIPVVAAIEGVCFGGGFELALAAHVRIASEKAMFAFPEVNHDLIPGMTGTIKMLNRKSAQKGMEMILSGEIYHAAEMQIQNLVDDVVPSKTTFEHALKWIQSITNNRSHEVINAVMRCLNYSRTHALSDAINFETKEFVKLASNIVND